MAKKKNYTKSFFIELNVQNAPKPKARIWYVRKADANSIPNHWL